MGDSERESNLRTGNKNVSPEGYAKQQALLCDVTFLIALAEFVPMFIQFV